MWKNNTKMEKTGKGCALSKPRQYFSWGARKKNTHFFTKKLSWRRFEPRTIWWEATALPTEPQRRSHWTKLKTGSHSYLAREIFSGSKLCLGATLQFTISVCPPLLTSLWEVWWIIVKKKISKKSWGIEPQMSVWVATALPPDLFRTFNLSCYFTKKML